MKQYYIYLLFILLFPQYVFSQNITVKSFRKIENSMTARIDAPKKDRNGDVCAIIKIVTIQTGFSFEGDGAGVYASEYNAAEYWVWIGYGAKRLTLKHPKYGILRDFQYPIPIEKATDYEMVLSLEMKIADIIDTSETKWLVITTEPPKSSVFINNIFSGQGVVSKKIKPGISEYKVEAPYYHSFDSIVLIKNQNTNVSVKLKPAFGFLKINTIPEDSATITIDGNLLKNRSPLTTDTLASGEHNITVSKNFFLPQTQKAIVKDNTTSSITFKLPQNYADVEISTLDSTPIWVNNQFFGVKYWKGRLLPGNYLFEARHLTMRTESKQNDISNGDIIKIEFIPTSTFKISTSPENVNIKIDDVDYGSSPKTIPKISVGEHKITFAKESYANIIKFYNLKIDETTTVFEKLEPGKELFITSSPSELDVFADSVFIGKTPLKYSFTFGPHIIITKRFNNSRSKYVLIDKESKNNLFIDMGTPNKNINITSFPTAAEIYVDDILIGNSPQSFLFPFGNHTIKVKTKNRTKEKSIIIDENSDNKIFMDLRIY